MICWVGTAALSRFSTSSRYVVLSPARPKLTLATQHKERAPRESKLLPEFEQCIEYLNQFLPPENTINYIPWDISAANKQYVHSLALLAGSS